MRLAHITTDRKAAGKAAWMAFAFCTTMMALMALASGWPLWIEGMLLFHLAVLSGLTFYAQGHERLQSGLMMFFSFVNIFTCTVVERNIYPAMPVVLGATILLMAYGSAKLLLAFTGLQALEILFHIFVLRTVQLDTPLHVIEFIVRVSVLFTGQLFLTYMMMGLNANNAQMRRSVEEARRAEHYKSDFLANMSHEIRTPMNAIVGMCELILRENTLSDSARENCFNIQASGKSLLSIINDILDFSKIESGNMELINAQFNIASILNDVINMSEARRHGKHIDIIVNAQPDIPRGLIGDEVRIRQVIINLMTNAIKFTERGRVTLSVSCTRQAYGVNLAVSVADTGIGITEENIEKLFTSFRQVNTRKNRSVEGTGLGLAICKQFIRQMGGFISVQSQYGAGSEFRFAIPLQVADGEPFVSVRRAGKLYAAVCLGDIQYAAEQTAAFAEACDKLGVRQRSAANVDELRGLALQERFTHLFVTLEEYQKDSAFFEAVSQDMRVFVIQDRMDNVSLPDGIKPVYKPFYVIPVVSALNNESIVLSLNERRGADIRFTAPKAKVLIVDDHVINLKVASGLMQPYNMQIKTAQNGPDAIAIVREQDVDLVFMDHMMADMDGVETTGIIRQMEGEYFKNLPIVALTANAVNGVREMYLASGFNDFLAKPIELSALDRILRTYLPREYLEAPTKTYYGKVDRRGAAKPQEGSVSLLDTELGLSYMGRNEDAYREILALYLQKSEEKIRLIRELFQAGDAKNYTIEVHALKSASMSIGAARLSERAKELEAIGKAGNLGIAQEKNDELLKLYAAVAEAVREHLAVDDEGEAQPRADQAQALSEISAERLKAYIARAKDACRGFDAKQVEQIAAETAACAFGGEPLRETFARAAQLAQDFEYEAAENALAALEEKIKDRG